MECFRKNFFINPSLVAGATSILEIDGSFNTSLVMADLCIDPDLKYPGGKEERILMP
jgi:hypothetical protein